jgi:hypothetical protein
MDASVWGSRDARTQDVRRQGQPRVVLVQYQKSLAGAEAENSGLIEEGGQTQKEVFSKKRGRSDLKGREFSSRRS